MALGFNTLYLQLLGFSDMRAATLQALFLLGVSLGSFGGGYIGEIVFPVTEQDALSLSLFHINREQALKALLEVECQGSHRPLSHLHGLDLGAA